MKHASGCGLSRIGESDSFQASAVCSKSSNVNSAAALAAESKPKRSQSGLQVLHIGQERIAVQPGSRLIQLPREFDDLLLDLRQRFRGFLRLARRTAIPAPAETP